MIRFVALVAVLPVFSVAPLVLPAMAQEACMSWLTEMLEDEGGPVLTASVCATDRPDAYLLLTCSGGAIWVRYDLSAGAEALPDLGEVTDVVFRAGDIRDVLSMTYQEMDARHAADVPVVGSLVALLKSGDHLSIVDAAGNYPVHEFSLKGSSAALTKLVAGCS